MDLTEAAQSGYDASQGATCPHYTSSPAGMGWLAGRYLRTVGASRPRKAAMSRGYRVRIDGVRLIDCADPEHVRPVAVTA